jgi:trans-aconitate 2-methyltransferase
MLHTAQPHAGRGLRFELGDMLKLPAEPKYDVIFSNAALHWLSDHPALFDFLTARLAPHGQLAVQVPTMEAHPVHSVAKEVAREPRFAAALQGCVHNLDLPSAEQYAEMLWRLGFARQNVRLQIYAHILPGPEAAIEWIKGTLLTTYQEKLDAATFDEFLAEYSQRLLARLPTERPCFFPYKRILIWGRRG